MPKISKCLFKHTYNSIELQEKNNRMGKTRNLFKQIGDIKGTFHARMGMVKEIVMTYQKQKMLRRGGKNTETNERRREREP